VDGVTLLRQARAAGLSVRADGDRLAVEGPRRLEPVARALLDAKPGILAALEREAREIAWRIEAMRRQLPERGAIPLLLARNVTGRPPGSCCSCGDPLAPGDRFRCQPCTAAIIAVLEAIP
jgi:hypothetical protein